MCIHRNFKWNITTETSFENDLIDIPIIMERYNVLYWHDIKLLMKY